MAQIDIRNATVRIKDGYVGIGAGAVNNVAGYPTTTTVIAVDLFVGAITTNDRVSFAGDSTRYTVTAHTETLGNTTSITISPGLVLAVVDDQVVTVLPHQLDVFIGDGNLVYDEKRVFKYVRNRGRLQTVRQEQDEPVDVTIDAVWEFLRGDTTDPPTVEETLKKVGRASTWVSSAADKCEPYAVDVEIDYVPPCVGIKQEVIEINDFRYESFNHDLKTGVLVIKGKANVTDANVTRVT